MDRAYKNCDPTAKKKQMEVKIILSKDLSLVHFQQPKLV